MSDKEVRIRITGDASDLLKKLEAIKDSFDDLGKNSSSNKFMNNLTDEISDGIKKLDQLKDGVEDVADATKKIGKNNNISDMADDARELNKELKTTADSTKELNQHSKDIDAKQMDAYGDAVEKTNKQMINLRDTVEGTQDILGDIGEMFDGFDDQKFKLKFIDDADPNTFLDDLASGFMSGAMAGKVAGDMIGNSIGNVTEEMKELANIQEEVMYNYKHYIQNMQANVLGEGIEKAVRRMQDLEKIINDLEGKDPIGFDQAMDSWMHTYKAYERFKEQMEEMRAPLNEQVEAYEKLKKASLEFINNEKNHIALREKAARYLEESRQSLEHMGAELEGIPQDVFKKLTKDVNDFIDSVKKTDRVISFDKLEKELGRLEKSIDDKTLKKVINDESFDSANYRAKKVVESFKDASDSIKDFAENATYAFEKIEVNGQVIDSITGDIEKLDKAANAEHIQELNEALAEYQILTREFGGSIADRFLTDGVFDPAKYVEEYERMGKPLNQLTMQYKALKQQVLESLKSEKDSLDTKAKNVKAVNEQAEALRKLGAAVEDINRADIEGFDKTLASKLDNIKKVFKDENLPKTIEEFKESLSAVFDEFNNLEFGKGLDLLKDVGKGFAQNIFAKIPAGAKAAALAIGGVSTALYKLYEAGKKQFFEGLSNAANKLRPVIDMLQNFGQEVVAAFEEITNTDLDFSSLMALGPNFEHQMQKVASIAGSTDKQLVQLTRTAEELGGKTQFSASQVGEAFEYMAMAGYSTEEMLSSIDGVLNLAIASGTDLATTSDIVTDYMTAMGMEASNTSDFVDKLAATITSSNTTVEQFGNAMKQVGSQAGMLGISMTDVSTAIGLAANAGVKGAKSGTALKNLLANMAAPTKAQAAALQKLGFSLNETGTYFELTKDGAVDLEGTMKKLMTATKDMDGAQKAALITAIAGKEAMPGILAILNQGEEAWTELSNTIENSSGKVQYWNECMELAGKSGKGATDLIENMKKVFEETESAALELGLSTEDLSHAIAVLGDDGKVSAENIQDLFEVIKSMNEATGETEKLWRDLDGSILSDVNKGWDYDGTIANITADTQGLTQAEKEGLKTRLEGIKSYEEAQRVAEAYGEEINKQRGTQLDLSEVVKQNSFATMSYADKLRYLRDNYKELGEEAFKTKMEELGLGDSMDELNEICKMSDEEFNAYTHNLETVQGMAEQLAEAMDETTKASFLNLASAIENVAIGAFNKLKPVIKGVSDALCDFFDTWHNGEKNEFTWHGFEMGLVGLASKIKEQKGNIQKAVAGLFDGIDRFVNGSSLDNILTIGTHVITGICDGINEAKENGSLDDAINGAITKICDWINQNGPQIEKAGKTIIDSITDGIKNNKKAIGDALDTICSVISSWADSSSTLRGQLSKFADSFAKLAIDSIGRAIKEKFKDVWHSLFDFGGLSDPNSGGIFASTNIVDLLFGKDWDPIGDIGKWMDKRLSGFSLYRELKKRILGNKTTSKGQDAGAEPIKISDLFGDWHPIEDLKKWLESKFGDFNLWQFLKQCILGTTSHGGSTSMPATTAMITPANIFGNWDPIGDIKKWIQSKFGNFNLIQTIKDALKKGGTTSKGADSGSEPIKISDLFGNWDPIGKIKEFIGSKLKGFNIFKCIKDYLFGETYAAEVGGGSGGSKSDIKPEQIIKIPSLGDIKEYISSKFKGFSITKFIKDTLFNKQGNSGGSGGKSDIKPEQLVNIPSLEDIKSWIGSKFKGFNIREHIKTLLLGGAGAVGGAIGGAAQLAIKAADIFGEWNPIEDMKSWLDEKIGDWSITKWIKEKMGGGKDGEGAGKIDAGELLQIDTEKLGQIEQQLQTLSTTATTTATNVSTAFTGITDSARTSFVNLANIVRNQMLNISNIISNQVLNARNAFTTQFLSMAAVARTQMVNVSNIIRNQAVSWSNIIRNQVTNARNAFTSQFISMASVARTQMVNVSNIVRNQAVSWSNIIRNQVTNARNALTTQMLSMAAVTRTQMVNISNIVRNQMVNCTNIVRNQGSNMATALSSSLSRLSSSVASSMSRVVSTVRSYISQIKALCSQTFTMNFKANISKTVTTTNVTKSVTKGIQSAVASINRNSFALAAPQATPIGGSIGSNPANNVAGNASLTVNAPLYLDGREIARATAKYNEAELNKLSKRNSRKRGE